MDEWTKCGRPRRKSVHERTVDAGERVLVPRELLTVRAPPEVILARGDFFGGGGGGGGGFVF